MWSYFGLMLCSTEVPRKYAEVSQPTGPVQIAPFFLHTISHHLLILVCNLFFFKRWRVIKKEAMSMREGQSNKLITQLTVVLLRLLAVALSKV